MGDIQRFGRVANSRAVPAEFLLFERRHDRSGDHELRRYAQLFRGLIYGAGRSYDSVFHTLGRAHSWIERLQPARETGGAASMSDKRAARALWINEPLPALMPAVTSAGAKAAANVKIL